uniref:Methyltransferase domain-containing protein n=1 Tax=Candidatus Kentrum sp. FM TaxID=2126340 RepID=A0A450SD96_9GAMM|nr:MAG: Methyltransferase domain-containing protein [Candidatus Kentron sp. FM]VFJ50408.1 MAG: Methyltransferase domain-containing protein [Candidatus Kentron sp. FM]VFK08680.1 MAG: Methyltransferase domain-containing protein [Candidatus Kentron sp. FM]
MPRFREKRRQSQNLGASGKTGCVREPRKPYFLAVHKNEAVMSQYYDLVPLDVYDETIVGHPYIDACNASLLYHLLLSLEYQTMGKHVLDIGTGTGQVVRLLRGVPGLKVSAQDKAPESAAYFQSHPELQKIPFHLFNAVRGAFPSHFDVITCRGVLHHIPKSQRVTFLSNMLRHADHVIIADEAVANYQSEQERIAHCREWYGFVIKESRRRGLNELAEVESKFLAYDVSAAHDDEMDFKEDLPHIRADIEAAGGWISHTHIYGPWKSYQGGFYTVCASREQG